MHIPSTNNTITQLTSPPLITWLNKGYLALLINSLTITTPLVFKITILGLSKKKAPQPANTPTTNTTTTNTTPPSLTQRWLGIHIVCTALTFLFSWGLGFLIMLTQKPTNSRKMLAAFLFALSNLPLFIQMGCLWLSPLKDELIKTLLFQFLNTISNYLGSAADNAEQISQDPWAFFDLNILIKCLYGTVFMTGIMLLATHISENNLPEKLTTQISRIINKCRCFRRQETARQISAPLIDPAQTSQSTQEAETSQSPPEDETSETTNCRTWYRKHRSWQLYFAITTTTRTVATKGVNPFNPLNIPYVIGLGLQALLGFMVMNIKIFKDSNIMYLITLMPTTTLQAVYFITQINGQYYCPERIEPCFGILLQFYFFYDIIKEVRKLTKQPPTEQLSAASPNP